MTRPAVTDTADTPLDTLAAAILCLVGEADGADLLRFVTDRQVAVLAGTSPARVRRVFAQARGNERLDREWMLAAAVAQALERDQAVQEARAARWLEAAELPCRRDVVQLAAVVVAPWRELTLDRRDEKAVQLAGALVGEDPQLAALLSYAAQRSHAVLRGALTSLLDASGWRVADGVSVDQVMFAITAVVARARNWEHLEAEVGDEQLERLVARMLVALIEETAPTTCGDGAGC